MTVNLPIPYSLGPASLTDRRNEICTVDIDANAAGLTPPEISRLGTSRSRIIRLGGLLLQIDLQIRNTTVPKWLEPTLNNIGSLVLLSPGWDKQGAPAVQIDAINMALAMLSQLMADGNSVPQWTPTPKGGVQLDWHENAIDLEIEFDRDASDGYAVFSEYADDSTAWDGPVSKNMHRLRALFGDRLNARTRG